MKTKRGFSFALVGMMTVFAALQGCDDDGDENVRPPTVKPTGGSTGQGGDTDTGGAGNTTSTAGKSSKGGSTTTGGTGAEGGAPLNPVGGAGGEGGAPEPECLLPALGEDGCFNCPKNGEVEQWLNRCVDSECEPFDNSRLPLLKADGTLPKLP